MTDTVCAAPSALATPAPPRFVVTMLMSLQPGGALALDEFRRQATDLFDAHDVRIERSVLIAGQGQIVPGEALHQPNLIQIVSFPSPGAFKAYLADSRYAVLAPQRDAALQSLTVVAGPARDVADMATPGCSTVARRLYGVAFARFKVGGGAGMEEFNRLAQPLFARHGMHVESAVDVRHVASPMGPTPSFEPGRVIVFFVDDAADLQRYVADPEYQALAPLRDSELERYDFFLGTALTADGASA